jgi:hypothetical protein
VWTPSLEALFLSLINFLIQVMQEGQQAAAPPPAKAPALFALPSFMSRKNEKKEQRKVKGKGGVEEAPPPPLAEEEDVSRAFDSSAVKTEVKVKETVRLEQMEGFRNPEVRRLIRRALKGGSQVCLR